MVCIKFYLLLCLVDANQKHDSRHQQTQQLHLVDYMYSLHGSPKKGCVYFSRLSHG